MSLCNDLGLMHAVDPFVRPSLTPELIYWRLHGNGSHYASYTDAELDQLRQWLPAVERGRPRPRPGEAYVMFNNIPRPRRREAVHGDALEVAQPSMLPLRR